MNTSPLNSSKTPNSIVTEILMMRSTFKGIHFLVEGEDDSKFWKDYLHRASIIAMQAPSQITNFTGFIL